MKIAYIGIDLFYPALEVLSSMCEITEIFTCETDNETEFNIKIIEFAEKNSIPYTKSRITKKDIERLKKKGCNAAVCAGYYFKIPADTSLKIVNIHPSLLPVGRGSWPMPQTILRGLEKSGVTIHKIVEEFDAGDILLQEKFALDEKETLVGFMEKVYGLLPDMLKNLVMNFDELYENAVPQEMSEYWEAPKEEDFTIYPETMATEADLILRAFMGYDCIYKTAEEKYILRGGRVVQTPQKFVIDGGYIKAENIKKYPRQ